MAGGWAGETMIKSVRFAKWGVNGQGGRPPWSAQQGGQAAAGRPDQEPLPAGRRHTTRTIIQTPTVVGM